MLRILIIAISLVSLTQTAQGQSCQDYVGQMIKVTTVPDLYVALYKLPNVKDEFETTDNFNLRVRKSLEETKPIYIVEFQSNKDKLKYDADNEMLQVPFSMFLGSTIRWRNVFGYGTKFDGLVDYGFYMGTNVDLTLSSTEKLTGTYFAKNGFGASAKVSKINIITYAIFDRQYQKSEKKFGENGELFELPVKLENALQFKKRLRFGVVITPKAPWFAEGDDIYGAPTISNPRDVKEWITTYIADIQCAIVMDEKGKVLAAIETP
jgi:hypothetical protein